MNRITFGLLLVLACAAPAVAQRVEWQARIPGGPGLPGGENRLAACSATGRLYVSGDESCGVRIVEESRMLVTGVLPTPTPVREMFHHEGLCRMFCGSVEDDEMYVFDCRNGQMLAAVELEGPVSGLAFASGEGKLYVQTDAGTLEAVDVQTLTVRAVLEVGGRQWYWTRPLCYAEQEHALFWSDQPNSRLLVFDCRADTLLGQVPLPYPAMELAYNPANNCVYCACHDLADMMPVVDAASRQVVAQITGIPGWYVPAVNARYNKVYCCGTSWDNFIIVVDGSTNTISQRIEYHGPGCFDSPVFIEYEPVHDRLYAGGEGCFCGCPLQVVDGRTDSVLFEANGLDEPTDFCLGPSGTLCWEASWTDPWGVGGILACNVRTGAYGGAVGGEPSVVNVALHAASGSLAASLDWPSVALVCSARSGEARSAVWLGPGETRVVASPVRPLLFALTDRYDSSHAYLSVVDVESLRVLRRHRLPTSGYLCVDSVTDRLYVVTALPGGAMLWVFDGEGSVALVGFTLPADCGRLYPACDGTRLVSVGRENLHVIDVDGMQLVSSVHSQGAVTAFCTDARGTRGYFLQENSVGISVLDIGTGEVRGRIPLLAVANQMTYDPETDWLYCLMDLDSLVEVRGATATGYHEFIGLPEPAFRSFLAAPGVLLFATRGGFIQYDCRIGELRDEVALEFTPEECLPIGGDSLLLLDYDACQAALVTLAPRRPGVRVGKGDDQLQATIVRGVLRIGRPLTADGLQQELIDATGRKVMDLKAGDNDVSGLAPGIYFVRTASGVARDASSVTKVVIAR